MISYILEYLFQDEYNKDNKVHDIIENVKHLTLLNVN